MEGYVDKMRAWVDAVEEDEPIDDLIPVNGAPTIDNAKALGSRLRFIEERITPYRSTVRVPMIPEQSSREVGTGQHGGTDQR